MAKDLHKFDQKFIDFLLRDSKYKFIRLLNTEGEVLVLWNNVAKGGTTLTKKVEEIKNRLRVLPDGIYMLEAKFIYQGKATPDKYYIQKGNATLSEAVVLKEKPAPEVLSKSEQITSVDSALSRIEEMANLRAENAALKLQVAELEKENLELQAELDSVDEMGEGGEAPGIGGWLKELGTLVPSISDEYFKMRNRELDLKEASLKVDYLKARGKAAPQVRKNPRVVNSRIDPNNEAQMNELYDYLEGLDDDEFEKKLEEINKAQPDLVPYIVEEFGLNEAGEPEEEEDK